MKLQKTHLTDDNIWGVADQLGRWWQLFQEVLSVHLEGLWIWVYIGWFTLQRLKGVPASQSKLVIWMRRIKYIVFKC